MLDYHASFPAVLESPIVAIPPAVNSLAANYMDLQIAPINGIATQAN